MIATLEGQLVEKHPTKVLVEVNGLGYEVHIPLSTYETLGEVGEPLRLHTHHYVREDLQQLFGFHSPEEKHIFSLLLSVSGIGPKSALGILSSIGSAELQRAIVQENVDLLVTAPGVGRKSAQRLIIELKEKMVKAGEVLSGEVSTDGGIDGGEAVMALVSLGYNKSTAEKTVAQIIRQNSSSDLGLEECIKLALRALTRS